MYVALFVVMIACGVVLVVRADKRRAVTMVPGIALILLTIGFFAFLDFWGEMLWFDALGYEARFWTLVLAQTSLLMGGALLGAIAVFLLTMPNPKVSSGMRVWPVLGGALVGGLWAFFNWEVVLRYVYGESTGVYDPILGRDTGFYLFTLPFYDALYWGLVGVVGISLLTAFLSEYTKLSWGETDEQDATFCRRLCLPLVGMVLVVAWGQYLNRYHLVYSEWGAVTGAGWMDVYIRLPGYWMAAGTTLVLGLMPLIPAVRRRFSSVVHKWSHRTGHTAPLVIAVTWAGILVTWVLVLGAVPALVQWLVVVPNEITLERPYLEHNIEFTRRGFGLHRVEERQFPVAQSLSREIVDNNKDLISEVRLWDWRALAAVYRQFQEIRLYYVFPEVDVDRYHTRDGYRQVMAAARELKFANLPRSSQTFVNERFKYTHGYGLTLAPVSDFTPDGLPNLLIKDIPPRTVDPALRVAEPAIYYGELTDSHVFVNTTEPEFDYPSGDTNVYSHYQGSGGVKLFNLWRKFLFGWKFDGTRFLLSTYPTRETRVLFHRAIRERVETLAPFLTFDEDPYITLVGGKLFWIIDGYTTSRYYPYSEPFPSTEVIEYLKGAEKLALVNSVTALQGVNYVRNSVKAIIDAFNGTVTFYVFDSEDPIIGVWQRIFPGLFKPKEAMPAELRAHVRYPIDFLLAQGLVYAKYHMTDPTVFYNQEDLWVRATEKYYADIQPVEPYYIMWKAPDSDAAEFTLILPFTPKNRQVLIGWIAGMSDPGNYGRLLAYKFSKDERVLGTQQVETKIDQDRFLSAQLSLWDQRGSRVIRGNVLVIPVDNTLLYVEPIYLQAEAAAYPELRLVAVMHNDRLSYGESFDEALEGLFEGDGQPGPTMRVPALVDKSPVVEALAAQARDAFESYLRLQGKGRFMEAGRELERLAETLRRLPTKSGGSNHASEEQ